VAGSDLTLRQRLASSFGCLKKRAPPERVQAKGIARKSTEGKTHCREEKITLMKDDVKRGEVTGKRQHVNTEGPGENRPGGGYKKRPRGGGPGKSSLVGGGRADQTLKNGKTRHDRWHTDGPKTKSFIVGEGTRRGGGKPKQRERTREGGGRKKMHGVTTKMKKGKKKNKRGGGKLKAIINRPCKHQR